MVVVNQGQSTGENNYGALEYGCCDEIEIGVREMLELVPKNMFSWDFWVVQDGTEIALIDQSLWQEKGEFAVDGATYKVYREGLMSGEFILEGEGKPLAKAEKPSAFFRSFKVTYEGKNFEWKARSAFGRGFVLLDGDTEVGSVTPESMFGRKAAAVLPEEFPMPVKVFMMWLAIILWERAAKESSSNA